jgi:hypothetical protein
MTHSIKVLFAAFSIMTFSITTRWHYAEWHYAECHYAGCHFAEFRVLFTVVLNVIMLSVVMLSVVMLSVVTPLGMISCCLGNTMVQNNKTFSVSNIPVFVISCNVFSLTNLSNLDECHVGKEWSPS